MVLRVPRLNLSHNSWGGGKARQVDAKVVAVVCCCCCEAGESPVDGPTFPRWVCVTIVRWPFLQNYTCILVVFLAFFWCSGDVNSEINISVQPCVKPLASLFQHRAQNATQKGHRSVGLDGESNFDFHDHKNIIIE